MRTATGKVPIVDNPVFSSVADDRSVRLLDFQHCKVKSHPSDLGEQKVAEVLYTGRSVYHLEPKCLTGSGHVLLQGFIKRVVNVDQHAMVVIFFQPRLNLRVEVYPKRADITITFYLKVASQSLAMTMQIPAFVQQCLIAVCGVKLLLVLNDHTNVPMSVFLGPDWLISSVC